MLLEQDSISFPTAQAQEVSVRYLDPDTPPTPKEDPYMAAYYPLPPPQDNHTPIYTTQQIAFSDSPPKSSLDQKNYRPFASKNPFKIPIIFTGLF